MSIKNLGASQYNQCCRFLLAYRPQVFFPPSCLKKLFCERWILSERKMWVLWQWKCRSLSDGSAWPLPGSWWFHILTKTRLSQGTMKLEHRVPKNICYAQMLFFRASLPTEGWSKSHSKSNEMILYKNMCRAHVVTHENENVDWWEFFVNSIWELHVVRNYRELLLQTWIWL